MARRGWWSHWKSRAEQEGPRASCLPPPAASTADRVLHRPCCWRPTQSSSMDWVVRVNQSVRHSRVGWSLWLRPPPPSPPVAGGRCDADSQPCCLPALTRPDPRVERAAARPSRCRSRGHNQPHRPRPLVRFSSLPSPSPLHAPPFLPPHTQHKKELLVHNLERHQRWQVNPDMVIHAIENLRREFLPPPPMPVPPAPQYYEDRGPPPGGLGPHHHHRGGRGYGDGGSIC